MSRLYLLYIVQKSVDDENTRACICKLMHQWNQLKSMDSNWPLRYQWSWLRSQWSWHGVLSPPLLKKPLRARSGKSINWYREFLSSGILIVLTYTLMTYDRFLWLFGLAFLDIIVYSSIQHLTDRAYTYRYAICTINWTKMKKYLYTDLNN